MILDGTEKNTMIDPKQMIYNAERDLHEHFAGLDIVSSKNQQKVITAMQNNRLSDRHFAWNTGYGYDDQGRAITEKIFADVFGTEASLVRTQIVNGTHAISLMLTGILRPGDQVIFATGKPYDTLFETVGFTGAGKGTLLDFDITHQVIDLTEEGHVDVDAVIDVVNEKTKVIYLQRATGYDWRPAITIDEIHNVCTTIKSHAPELIIMADNCYGEFLDTKEPTDVGVDIMAGSLIKNPGGGLALSGGYITGKSDLVELVSYRLTTPGIGSECGLTFGQTRNILLGFFLAPSVTISALKGAILCGQIFHTLGYDVSPMPDEDRSDIIQAIKLGSKEALLSFCRGVQSAAPVESFVTPEPWDMPGYQDQIIMAAGAFVQGSSIELSADGPIRDPFIVYFQGGLTYEHSKLGVEYALTNLINDGLLG